MSELTFLADAPDLSAFAFPDGAPEDIPAETIKPTSWVQLAKTGRFKHPIYGRFTITKDTLSAFIANRLAGIPQAEIAFDFDHAPDYTGDTEACGWIQKLELRANDGELWGYVEWLWDGAYAIRDGRYKFVSPTWKLNYASDDGTVHGPTLLGAALTNRPWFNQMAVVNISQFSAAFADVDDQVEAIPDDVESAKPGASDSRPAMDFTSTFSSRITEILGLDGEVTEDQILTAATEAADRAAKAPAEGDIVMTASEVAEMRTGMQAGQSAAKELAETKFENAFTAAVDAKFVAPAEKDSLKSFYDKDAEGALAYIASRQVKVVPDEPTGATGDPAVAPQGVDPDSFSLHQEIAAHQAEHKCSYSEAFHAVSATRRTA